jgi:chromosome segregation ATPase
VSLKQKRNLLEEALADRDQQLSGWQRRLDEANSEKQALVRKLNNSQEHASDMETEKDVITAECEALRVSCKSTHPADSPSRHLLDTFRTPSDGSTL